MTALTFSGPSAGGRLVTFSPDGKRLAKRDAAASLASLREAGGDGRALAADLAAGRLPAGYSLQMP